MLQGVEDRGEKVGQGLAHSCSRFGDQVGIAVESSDRGAQHFYLLWPVFKTGEGTSEQAPGCQVCGQLLLIQWPPILAGPRRPCGPRQPFAQGFVVYARESQPGGGRTIGRWRLLKKASNRPPGPTSKLADIARHRRVKGSGPVKQGHEELLGSLSVRQGPMGLSVTNPQLRHKPGKGVVCGIRQKDGCQVPGVIRFIVELQPVPGEKLQIEGDVVADHR